MGRKILIVGRHSFLRRGLPINKPGWETWGIPWDEELYIHFDRHFEMHDRESLEKTSSKRPPGYFDKLKFLAETSTLYMQEAHADIPGCKEYPFKMVIPVTGDYFNSSPAYALALAIAEHELFGADNPVESLGIYGINMDAGDDYVYQRANFEYLLGMAVGMGIKIVLPSTCPLMKFDNNGGAIAFGDHELEYVNRYGYLKRPRDLPPSVESLRPTVRIVESLASSCDPAPALLAPE